jgi:hypothetical protein
MLGQAIMGETLRDRSAQIRGDSFSRPSFQCTTMQLIVIVAAVAFAMAACSFLARNGLLPQFLFLLTIHCVVVLLPTVYLIRAHQREQ